MAWRETSLPRPTNHISRKSVGWNFHQNLIKGAVIQITERTVNAEVMIKNATLEFLKIFWRGVFVYGEFTFLAIGQSLLLAPQLNHQHFQSQCAIAPACQ